MCVRRRRRRRRSRSDEVTWTARSKNNGLEIPSTKGQFLSLSSYREGRVAIALIDDHCCMKITFSILHHNLSVH